MSRIFDALQRSEADRSGSGAEAARITELLQRTESYAASKWGTADQLEDQSLADTAHQEPPTENHRDVPVVVPRERPAVTAVLPVEVHADGLSNSVPLRVSPPFQSRLVCLPNGESPAVEAFHLLGVRLRHLRRGRPLKKVLITSTIPQEGKSMVAANLACTLALRTQQKVLLLEGDVRRPTQSEVFGIGDSRVSANGCAVRRRYSKASTDLKILAFGFCRREALQVTRLSYFNPEGCRP